MEYGRDEVEEREDSACGDMNEDGPFLPLGYPDIPEPCLPFIVGQKKSIHEEPKGQEKWLKIDKIERDRR